MSTPVPGWYSDPAGSGRLRWWSGTEWTEQFQDAPATAVPSAEPLATGAVPQPVDSAAAPSAEPLATGAVPQQAHGAAGPSAQPEPVGAGSPRPAPSKGMLIACIAAWAVAVVLCVAMTISLGAFNKAGRAVEESKQGVADAQQAVDDANSLDLSGNGENE